MASPGHHRASYYSRLLFQCVLLASLTAGCNQNPGLPANSDLAAHCVTNNDCTAPTALCNGYTNQCVACLLDSQCPQDLVCLEGECTRGCSPERGCGDAGVCDVDAGVCRICHSDSDCTSDSPRCQVSTGRCWPCLPANGGTSSGGVDICPGGRVCLEDDNGGFYCAQGCKITGDCLSDGGASTLACCSNLCIDTQASKANCGGCGIICDYPAACCAAQCNDFKTDANNCGACGNVCVLPNAITACAGGQCAVGVCNPGYADCNQVAADGCESSLATDPRNCGGCGMACMLPNAFTGCAHGCTIASCKVGFADCDAMAADGCEVDITSDPTNCGGCNMVCSVPHAAAGCIGGICRVAVCNGTFADCNMDPTDGCEIDIATDVTHCGSCNNACPVPQNGTATCTVGNCEVATCAAPFADCNDLFDDGCEIDTSMDPLNCGGCRMPCKLANAVPGCVMSACTVTACDGTFADCDAQPGDGCEVDTSMDPLNCGGCGMACATPANGSAACVMSACEVSACAPGYADCNGQFADGCEVNLLTDPNNCSACGMACNGQQICLNGKCAFRDYGTGSDGPLNVVAGTPVTLGAIRTTAIGTAGQGTLTAGNIKGFAAGQTLLIHQTQGKTAGIWELATAQSINGNVITLVVPLNNTYLTDATDHAQVLVVPQYTDVNVPNGAVLNAQAWDGSSGGILAFQATGTTTIGGNVTMDGLGFRGSTHPCLYRCMPGFSGESPVGPSITAYMANGSGGGGGSQGQDCGMAGGGAYATNGITGTNGSGGACAPKPQYGGVGGAVVGVADLTQSMLFGGAGGEGGGDEDGSRPGAGGNSGGIIVILSQKLVVTGAVHANGLNGGNGDSTPCINGGGGSGSGMGGGGGGAGGAIRVVSTNAAIGTSLLSVANGIGGTCSGGGMGAGAGGLGRIAIKSAIITGTTTPAFFGG